MPGAGGELFLWHPELLLHTPLPANGVGNISSDPQLASASHVRRRFSLSRRRQHAYTTGTDIDGEAWANPPSIVAMILRRRVDRPLERRHHRIVHQRVGWAFLCNSSRD